MSNTSNLDAREQEVRIDRMIAESRKFSAEQNKLAAEAGKLKWERVTATFLSGAAVATAIAALFKHFP